MGKYWGGRLVDNTALWLGFSVPESLAQDLFLLDPIPAVQTHKFGWSFARALKNSFGKVLVASSCPVQNFPLVRRVLFFGGRFDTQGMDGVLLGFINVILLKHITRLAACLFSVAPLIRRHRIEWIFIHGLHSPYLVFGLLAKLFGKRLVIVLTDPPGVILATDRRLARLMKGIDAWLIRRILQRVDAVFALAPELVRRLAPGRPAFVFPGILESALEISIKEVSSAKREEAAGPFTIVYAGGLSQAYGVDRLIDAVLGFSPDVMVCLKLFGRGDQEERIRTLALDNPRIIDGGFVDAATLLPELLAADLLINPRPTSELFATMSFPSKLIEYIATGRPVLTTRIPSIPESLKDSFSYIDDESVDGIRIAIRTVMETPVSQRLEHASSAKISVEKNFSEVAIGYKIAEFIDNLNISKPKGVI